MTDGEPFLFRALAVDYDGTLTRSDRPSPAVLDALAEVRARGLRLLLVTGRRLAALAEVLPDATDRFDAVVAENGAILACGDRVRALVPPVPIELVDALAARGVPLARGQVLLDTAAEHAAVALAEIQRLGLDVQLSLNRGALMLLPAGVTKGFGLFRALGELGISYHDVVVVGDAENDHSMFETCELAVAVANAVPALQAHADVVLSGSAGDGVVELLRGPILTGGVRVPSRRLPRARRARRWSAHDPAGEPRQPARHRGER
jgi:hydroxymethylpyrimidine pyrophosphatase-like HAD family hydrolase